MSPSLQKTLGGKHVKPEETPKQNHSITGYAFYVIFNSITKTEACNNGAGGSTERHVNLEIRLTVPQGKVKK